MDELGDRLEAGREAFAGLRDAVESREPWPLSRAYGVEPESDWGPKEVLAHVGEMAPYWLSQIEVVLAGSTEPVPFGRVVTDPERIARIGRDRNLPAGELFDRIDAGLAAVGARLDMLLPEAKARLGRHSSLGEMTVEGIVERFLVAHVEEHVRQLGEVLAARAGIAGDTPG
jgi:hypothetical protein